MNRLFINILLIFFSLSSNLLFSQDWMSKLPDKPKNQLTFFDYQNAFYTYWEPFNVNNGYYFQNGQKIKASGWNQFKRWEYIMKSQINPLTGEFPQKTSAQVSHEYFEAHPQPKALSAANWTSLGSCTSDGGYAGIGRINCIAFHPTNNNTYWVGSAGGGVWVTTDNANTWTCLTDDIGVMSISDILIPSDFATSNTIYIATGDKDMGWTSGSAGVLKSTDGGQNWVTTGLSFSIGNFVTVDKLISYPGNNNTILAATSQGLFRTTNGGSTWNEQVSTEGFCDLEYQPGNMNRIYASTRYGKIFLSTNGGTTWTQKYSNSNATRIELGVSPNQPNWVYAVIANTSEALLGVFKSTNSGDTYTSIYSDNILGYDSNPGHTGGGASYMLTIAVSPSNANILVIGGVNTWKSTNGGTTWTLSNYWYDGGPVPTVHADKHVHKYRSNGDLFEGNDGGIYISSNNGTSWTDKSNGLGINQIYRLGVSQSDATQTITGLQDNGTKLLANQIWRDVHGGDGMECLIDYTNAQIQYCTYTNGMIYRTMDLWTSSDDLITPTENGQNVQGNWVTPYIIDPSNPQTLYAGYEDVWKTTNRGTSWSKISNLNSNKLDAMAIAPSNTQVIYVADALNMWKTVNGGGSWTNITNSVLQGSGGSITSIAIKNNDPNTVWVTIGGFGTNHVFQSTNGGQNWSSISTGLPAIPALTIVQNKQETASVVLFVGTDAGVYVKNGNSNWALYNTNLPTARVTELEIYYATDPNNTKLRASTYGRGLWETNISGQSINLPIAGIANANTTICSNQTTVLSLSGSNGNIQWQQSTNGTSGWINVIGGSGANTTSYTTGALSQTMYFRVEVSLPNQTPVYSNLVTVSISTPLNLPLSEGFQGTFAPSGWAVYNPSNDNYTWVLGTTGNSSSQSAMINNNENNATGTLDELIIPGYSFSGVTNPQLNFDVAYARYNATYYDSLFVLASSDCGITWQTVYSKGNTALATVPDYSAGLYIPTASNHWRTETVNLTSFAGQANVMIKFRNKCGYGQALYIDNVNIQNTISATASVAITSSDADNTICAGTSVTFTATPTNGGAAPTYQWQVNGANVGTNSATYTSTSLTNGQSVTCIMTSNLAGVTGSPATSNAIVTTVNAIPSTPTVTTNSPVCAGSTINLTTPTVASATYAWTGPNSYSSTSQNPTIASATTAMSGTYSVVVTVNGCSSLAGTATVTVNTSLTPSVAIAITSGGNPTCASQSVTFTATPTNGGTSPTYQWTVNGSNVATGASYTPGSIANNDLIACVMTSSSSCASPTTATSNSITMTVTSTVTPSVSIVSNDTDNTICSGTGVTFTATPTNGGTVPTYAWTVNGAAAGTGATLTTTTLTNGASVVCTMTSNSSCASPTTATSNTISMTVNSSVTPTVSVSSSDADNSICTGESVTFTATPGNGGTSPIYAWTVNGSPAGTGGTFTTTSLTNGASVVCTMTSNASCASTTTATSTPITMSVSSGATPTVSISASSISICTGASVTFTPTPTNGGVPTYQWAVNGANVATGATFTSSSFNNNDAVTCVMTSTAACVSSTTATSNSITITVNNSVTPTISVAITNGSNPMCEGTPVTFTANGTNEGAAPSYQWQINGVNVGTNTATYNSSTLVNNDIVTCILTSNATCASPSSATSSPVTMSVTPTPATPTITNNGGVLTSSSSTGNQWYLNGVAIVGAIGQNYTPTQNGNYTVVVTSNGCVSGTSVLVTITGVGTEGLNENTSESFSCNVFPNPNNGQFVLTLSSNELGSLHLECKNLLGQPLISKEMDFNGYIEHTIDLGELATGEYLLYVKLSKSQTVRKIIIH